MDVGDVDTKDSQASNPTAVASSETADKAETDAVDVVVKMEDEGKSLDSTLSAPAPSKPTTTTRKETVAQKRTRLRREAAAEKEKQQVICVCLS